MNLFRKEVLEERKKLHGDVLVIQPISFYLMSSILVGLTALASTMLLTGSYVRSEVVQGYLVPSKGLIKVVPPRGGVISKIYVKQGDIVASGDPLVFMQLALATSEGVIPEARSLELIEEQQESLKNQIKLETQYHKLRLRQLSAEQSSLLQEIKALGEQIVAQIDITKLSKNTLEDAQLLQRKGTFSRIEVDRRSQAYLANVQQTSLLEQQLTSIKSRSEQIGFQIKQLPIESLQRTINLKSQGADLEARKVELEAKKGYLLTAPVSGTVSTLNFKEGRVVDARATLLGIMPENSVLEAQLFIPSRAIGFIETGKEVRLLFDAFPYQRFGSFEASIVSVSGMVMAPQELDLPFVLNEPTYKVLVHLDYQSFKVADSSVSLHSGMTLTANIILERQSFLDWVLQPLQSVKKRSG